MGLGFRRRCWWGPARTAENCMHPEKRKPPPPHDKHPPRCSLYCILARDGRSAVVFRRGPSKRVLVLRWWLADDRIELGQWFIGRLCERSCDLSPDGNLLVYFAARHKGELPTWTAVSRMPYLTALVLWKCYVDGVGVFDTSRLVTLSTYVDAQAMTSNGRVRSPMSDADLSRFLTVRRQSDRDPATSSIQSAGHGRLLRDGWTAAREAEYSTFGYSNPFLGRAYTSTQIYERPAPRGRSLTNPVVLSCRRFAVDGEPPLAPGFEEFLLRDNVGTKRVFTDCSWVDWQATGDLVFARGGCLYRVAKRHVVDVAADPLENAQLVADLRPMPFEQRPPPDWATRWE